MVATKRRPGLRVPLIILTLLALGLVATTGSVRRGAKPHAPVYKTSSTLVTAAIHDRSASLRGMAPQPAEAPDAVGVGVSEGNEVESATAAEPGNPVGAADAEQTAFGPRPAIPPVISFDNGLNGGSTSDNNIGVGPDSIVVMRNSQ